MRKPPKPLETYEQTKEKALRLLEFRSHSKKELFQKLSRQGAAEEHIEKTLEFLESYHLINDEDYAKRLALDLKNLKKYGRNRIKSELFERGISSQIVEEIISGIPDEEDGLSLLIEKRLKGDFSQKNIEKAMRYFIYRGYGASQIKRCIEIIKEKSEV